MPKYEDLFQRYFPKSYKIWKDNYFYNEPITLFTRYLENSKFPAYIFGNIFGSVGYGIKQIRRHNNFHECCFKNQISLLVVPELFNYYYSHIFEGENVYINELQESLKTLNKPYFFFNILPRLVNFYLGKTIIDVVKNVDSLPDYLKKIKGSSKIQRNPVYKLPFKNFIFELDDKDYILYEFENNIVVVNDNYANFLELSFQDFKKVLQ
ncbi:MAG: hypothetical protein SNJ77_10500 [Cytophagales bacterium]